MKENKSPKVSIGIPVYNGEITIKQAIDSVLKQSFTDFELIISDNASTDNTSKISKTFTQLDDRIVYISQEENKGPYWNFNFLLEKAKGEYFVWLADDDYWHPDFLLENINVLDNHKNIVCSIGKVETFEKIHGDKIKGESVQYPKFIENYVKKRRDQMIATTFPVSGPYSKKIRQFLKNTGSNSRFYGLYRKDILQKCFIKKPFVAVENAIFLNLLIHGDLYEVDKILLYRFNQGLSTIGIIRLSRLINKTILKTIFPFIPFNSWCLKNIGLKNILKNFDYFVRVNFAGIFFVLIDLLLKIRK